ncbi:major intrinsic protein domain-containing protein [Ditylenchus destructor]|uniref:Major intrinsic protein domain-containing protein n=1 Tax=Ditylenchus destructor TaxID=166010 RepID=A0AAD4N660_9BILA|nr:major intrinsic protein domain-containing protein [Ditylenchus destructor]
MQGVDIPECSSAPAQQIALQETGSNPEPQNAIDPWHRYYALLACEFIGSLVYTLFSNLLGIVGVGDSAAKLSIALLDGALNATLICMFGGISGGHFNPAITLAILLTFNLRLIVAFSMVFVQCFGAFFGAILTRATLTSPLFTDSFIALGILHRNVQANRLPDDPYSPMNTDESNGSRFQIFLMETFLSTLIVSTHLITSTYETVPTTAFSVGACRALVSLIGLSTLGQSANLARQLANSVVTSIFLLDDRAWRFFYITFFAALGSSILGTAIWWLIKGTLVEPKVEHAARRRVLFAATTPIASNT